MSGAHKLPSDVYGPVSIFLDFLAMRLVAQMASSWCLICVSKTRETLTEPEHVPVTGKHHDGDLLAAEALLKLQSQINMVDARHVAATRWGRILRIKGKRVNIDEAIRNVGVILEWLHKAEPYTWFRTEP